MLRRQFLMSAAAIASTLLAYPAAAQDTVKVGLIVPMTGQQASTGKQIDAAVKLYQAQHGTTVAGKNRAEGIRLFALAGRPSKEDFVKVYGPAGPKMTWEQRAKAGVPAEKFQSALAAAMRK